MKIVTTGEMIDLERRSDEAGVPPSVLMEHAGLAIAQRIHSLTGNVAGRDIVVLAGPGNNGGRRAGSCAPPARLGGQGLRLPSSEAKRQR